MRDRHPLSNIIEFVGQKGWMAETNKSLTELQGAISDLQAFNECYLMFSPKCVTPANRNDYERELRDKVRDKLADCLVMLEGMGVISGEEETESLVSEKGRELFARYEEELSNCIAVADYMEKLRNKLDGHNSKS